MIDHRRIAVVFGAFLLATGSALADGNQLRLLQQNESGRPGNTITIEQSGVGSTVAGLQPGAPASQIGSGNSADIKISGSNSQLGLLQDSTTAAGTAGNTATIGLSGQNALAAVAQMGGSNAALLNVTGDRATGAILQNGEGNHAGLDVHGTGARGSIVQNGDANTTNLQVLGAGTAVDYTVNGDNTTNVPGSGVQVYSTGTSVSITQTTLR